MSAFRATRRMSAQAKAKRRNAAAAERNQKTADRYPLLAEAGLLEQIGVREHRTNWDGLAVQDDEFERAIEGELREREWRRRDKCTYAAYIQMLDEAIGVENREEVLADYDERWRDHTSMRQMGYRINYLNSYLATYLKRPPLEIFNECRRRLEVQA